jgi:hypothetical protein
MVSTDDRPGALGVGRCASGSSHTSVTIVSCRLYSDAGCLIRSRRIGRERDGHITQAGDINRRSVIASRANIARRRGDQPGAHIFVILGGNAKTNPVATHVG